MMDSGSVLAGRYRLISLLGRGGMGEVWRAEHLGLRAPVAVKLMGPSIATNTEALQRFNREAQAAATLRSPHVVQILDHGVDPETHTPFIAMELMEGESLAHRIERLRCLPPGEVSRVVTHVARALARAHEIGIVHRDLKPDNIFLVRNEDEEIAKVLDFGIAKAQGDSLAHGVQTQTGAVLGTPYYMSPEQIGGAKNVDHRSDLWALGVIACECLTGRRAFEADSIGALVLAVCTQPLPRPSALGQVPEGFDAWFERAVERDPARRFQSARELADSLKGVLGGEGSGLAATGAGPTAPQGPRAAMAVSVGPVTNTASGEPMKTSGGGRTALFVLAAGAVVVLSGVAFWLTRSSQESTAPEPTAEQASAVAEPPATARIEEPAPPVAEASSATAKPSATAESAAASAAPPTTAPATRPAAPKPVKTSPPAPTAPKSAPKPGNTSSSVFDRRKG